MKIVNLDFNLKDLEGKEAESPIVDENNQVTGYEKVNVGKLVANLLSQLNEGDPIKFISWGIDWYKGKDVYLDESDFKKLYDIIEKSKQLSNIMKYNILKYLDGVEDAPVVEKGK